MQGFFFTTNPNLSAHFSRSCVVGSRNEGHEYGVEVDVYRKAGRAEGPDRSDAFFQSAGTTSSARIRVGQARPLSRRQIGIKGSARIWRPGRRRTQIPQSRKSR